MDNSSDVSRRGFLKVGATGAAVAAASTIAAPAPARAAGANDRIRLGFIGPGGRGFGAHIRTLNKLRKDGANIDLVAVSDVYTKNQERATGFIEKETGIKATLYEDYHDMLADKNVDAVCIATPDHWHAKQSIDAMRAGKHVYCEKPMTHTIQEAMDVVDAWRETGRVMQVGVQSTSLPIWDRCRELIDEGKLGKVLQFQTEFFRNSDTGQWRKYGLTKEQTPQTINWRRFLGVDEGLAPDMPFDRAVFAQWRCYWPFGSGMYTDLFVHRTTAMLKGTGLRYPGRVVGAGGIFLEYDGRDVPDVATVVADYNEGAQAIITATMCSDATPIQQLIRGHHGSFVFGNGEEFTGFDFIPERPQVTRDSKLQKERIEVGPAGDTTYAHFKNFLAAVADENPALCNNQPDLGAAAIVTVNLGSRSYREGKAFFFDPQAKRETLADESWAARWEKMSKDRAHPVHVPGWKAGDYGSLLRPPEHMNLAGPWIDGKPPEDQPPKGAG
ncbi:MAG TPA: Gfo/Idh/MocA family oxidoreductase [Pirellulales bacterium]